MVGDVAGYCARGWVDLSGGGRIEDGSELGKGGFIAGWYIKKLGDEDGRAERMLGWMGRRRGRARHFDSGVR